MFLFKFRKRANKYFILTDFVQHCSALTPSRLWCSIFSRLKRKKTAKLLSYACISPIISSICKHPFFYTADILTRKNYNSFCEFSIALIRVTSNSVKMVYKNCWLGLIQTLCELPCTFKNMWHWWQCYQSVILDSRNNNKTKRSPVTQAMMTHDKVSKWRKYTPLNGNKNDKPERKTELIKTETKRVLTSVGFRTYLLSAQLQFHKTFFSALTT